MSAPKIVVAVLWFLLLSCFFVATRSTASFVVSLVFWVLIITHLVECAAFFPTLRRAPGSLAGHLTRTLLFGFLHVRDVRALSSEDAPPC